MVNFELEASIEAEDLEGKVLGEGRGVRGEKGVWQVKNFGLRRKRRENWVGVGLTKEVRERPAMSTMIFLEKF